MSTDNATPAMWDAAARAAREMYHNKFEGTDLQMPSIEYKIEKANPKQAHGDKKVPLHLVPGAASAYTAMGLKEGARKYGAFNWRETNIETMTYVGATLRHLSAFVDGEDIDPESGNPHLAHAMASLAILIDAIESNCAVDNRPVSGPAAKTLEAFKND